MADEAVAVPENEEDVDVCDGGDGAGRGKEGVGAAAFEDKAAIWAA
jgi:hypothetical protein